MHADNGLAVALGPHEAPDTARGKELARPTVGGYHIG